MAKASKKIDHRKKQAKKTAHSRKKTVPRIFRIIIHVTNGLKGTEFYSKLLGIKSKSVGGGRHYFNCGPVILALLETEEPTPIHEYIYFAVSNLEAFHARAKELGSLHTGAVHDASAGEIVKRPWGERSFYAYDPFGNGLCLVDSKTLFTGK